MSGKMKITTSHLIIRQWAEERGAEPRASKATSNEVEAGRLQFQFPGKEKDNNWKAVSWDAFLNMFDEEGLCFVYKEKKKKGKLSHFGKFIQNKDAVSRITSEANNVWIIIGAAIAGIALGVGTVKWLTSKNREEF